MKIKDLLEWELSAYEHKTGSFIYGDDIEELSVKGGGIVVFHKNGQFLVPEEGSLSISKPEDKQL